MLRLQRSSLRTCSNFTTINSPISCSYPILQNQFKPIQKVPTRNLSWEGYLETINSGMKYLGDSQVTKSFMEQMISVHEFTGMPWWMVIVGSSVFFRTIMTFPAQVFTQHVIVRRKLAYEELENKTIPALQYLVARDAKKNMWTKEKANGVFREKQYELIETTTIKYNCVRKKMYLPQYIQMPLWMCMTVAWNKLITSKEYNSEFLTQGPILMPDLISTSPTILPICIGVLFMSSIQVNLLIHKIEKKNKLGKFLMYFANGMILFLVYLSTQAHAGIALYWASSAATGLASNLILVSPKAKKFFRIKIFPEDPDKPYQTIYNNAIDKYVTKVVAVANKLKPK